MEREGIQANNSFALHLLRTTASSRSGNVLLSPLSVSFALGMTMNGAGGETLAEMNRTLGWGTRTRAETNVAYRDLRTMLPTLDNSTTIRIANGLWVRQPLVIDTGFCGRHRPSSMRRRNRCGLRRSCTIRSTCGATGIPMA